MKTTLFLIVTTFIGCFTKRTNKVIVGLENNSDVDSVINVSTLINSKLYKILPVTRSPVADVFNKLTVELPPVTDSVTLTFIITKTGDSASCVLNNEVLRTRPWVHVNFIETVFKKGTIYLDHTLSRDILMRRKLYAEVIAD